MLVRQSLMLVRLLGTQIITPPPYLASHYYGSRGL